MTDRFVNLWWLYIFYLSPIADADLGIWRNRYTIYCCIVNLIWTKHTIWLASCTSTSFLLLLSKKLSFNLKNNLPGSLPPGHCTCDRSDHFVNPETQMWEETVICLFWFVEVVLIWLLGESKTLHVNFR